MSCKAIVSVVVGVFALTVSPVNGERKIYWTQHGWPGGVIRRANLDGSNSEDVVVTPGPYPTEIRTDEDGNKMYWCDSYANSVFRANLDGSDVELLHTVPQPSAVALDVTAGKIYFSDKNPAAAGRILRSSLDGSEFEVLVVTTDGDYISAIAIDSSLGKMYWTDNPFEHQPYYNIQRSNLNGSSIETLYTCCGLFDDCGAGAIALNLSAGKVYWGEGCGYPADVAIRRANLNGSSAEVLASVSSVGDIALDVDTGRIYWTDPVGRAIMRADLNWQNAEILLYVDARPVGIALTFYGNENGCDDGLFCNGTEWHDPVLGCLPGGYPCTDPDLPNCNEVEDECFLEDCCSTGHGPGCSGASGVEACVCAVDPYCCNVDWDDQCVQEVEIAGCGVCLGVNVRTVDCNVNGVVDTCEIDCGDVGGRCYEVVACGTGQDSEGNGIPDDCVLGDLFVNASAPPGGDGLSWETAFNNLDDALGVAWYGRQIWVAAGTYKPSFPAPFFLASFELVDGVELYGGFVGNEYTLAQRNPQVNVTTLSCDYNDDDGADFTNYDDNCEHVLMATLVGRETVVDGFVITGGNATHWDTSRGGGLYCIARGSPTIRNCRFVRNQAWAGGGLATQISSDPAVINCVFTQNRAVYSGDPMDLLTGYGGAFFSFPGVLNSGTLVNCTVTDNVAELDGGGLFIGERTGVTVTNCVLWNNTDNDGTDESAQVIVDLPNYGYTIDYSCIQGLTGALGGVGNIGDYPQLLPGGRLTLGSPCIDAGDDDAVLFPSDIVGNPRILDGNGNLVAAVDMGAFEFPATAINNNLGYGETDILNPGGGTGETTDDALAMITTNPDDLRSTCFIAVSETGEDLHPGAGGFYSLGTTLVIVTDLPDGQSVMTVSIPLGLDEQLLGVGPLNADLAYFDASAGNWELGVTGNTQPSPGHEPDPIGDRFEETGTVPPTIEELHGRDLGDYGVFWNTDTLQGFAWANVDYAGDFTGALPCLGAWPPQAEPDAVAKNRYISFVPGNPGWQTALRVTLTSLPPDFAAYEGSQMWVGPVLTKCENAGQDGPPPEGCGPAWLGGPALTMRTANLQDSQHCTDFGSEGVLHVTGCEIVPGATYIVEAIDCTCDTGNEASYSDPLTIYTSSWGNICGPWDVDHWSAPDTSVDVTVDVTACLDKFKNAQGAPIKARADIEPNAPDWQINIADVSLLLDAFGGDPYPFAGSGSCP